MKTAGWIFIVIGALAFLGAASKGHSVFGPLFWIGIGSVLIYLKREKEVTNAEKTIVKPIEKCGAVRGSILWEEESKPADDRC